MERFLGFIGSSGFLPNWCERNLLRTLMRSNEKKRNQRPRRGCRGSADCPRIVWARASCAWKLTRPRAPEAGANFAGLPDTGPDAAVHKQARLHGALKQGEF